MRTYDVVVSGAGPAGCCAAIGLRRHGYVVALLERHLFPRPHIGDVLTPDVRRLLEFLGVNDVLERTPTLSLSGTLRTWEEPDRVDTLEPNGAFVVDRGIFDRELRQAARAIGVDGFRCGSQLPVFHDGAWHVDVDDLGTRSSSRISGRFWIDARGRQPVRSSDHLALGPPTVAVWEEFSVPSRSSHLGARVEALRYAWMWAAPTTSGTYRALAVADPLTLRTEIEPSHLLDRRRADVAPQRAGAGDRQYSWLHATLARSTLMAEIAAFPTTGRRGICATGGYVHRTPWQSRSAKVADAAFAMDPLSSGGVSKAIRHALECVVAVHTALDGGASSEDVARHYYLSRLAESVANHARWLARHYREAWACQEPFWKSRGALPSAPNGETGLAEYLETQLAARHQSVAPMLDEILQRHILDGRTQVRLSPLVEFTDTVCVVDGKATIAPALSHPSIPRAVAFLQDVALVPLIVDLRQSRNLNAVVLQWSSAIRRQRAMQTMHWLLRNRFLEVCESA